MIITNIQINTSDMFRQQNIRQTQRIKLRNNSYNSHQQNCQLD